MTRLAPALALCAFATTAHAQGTTTVILGEPWARTYASETVNRIADAGFTHVLDYVHGNVDAPIEAWLDMLASRGLTPIVRIDGNRNDPSGYAAYAAGLVAAHPRVRIWQIGNEPDLWSPQWSGAQYVALANQITSAMRAADAGGAPMQIWGGVTSDLGDFWRNTFADPQGVCLSAPDAAIGMGTAILNAAPIFDVYAVHDYTKSLQDNPSVGCSDWGFFTTGTAQKANVQSRMTAIGLPTMAISEQGYALAWGTGNAIDRARQQAISEARQTVRAYWNRRLRIEYTFILASSNPLGSQEETFGLVNTVVPWSQRTAYDAVQRLNELVPPRYNEPTGTPVATLTEGRYQFYVYNHLVEVVWNGSLSSGLKRNLITGATVADTWAGDEPVWVWR